MLFGPFNNGAAFIIFAENLLGLIPVGLVDIEIAQEKGGFVLFF